MWHSRPPLPFMANTILNFHFDYRHPSLIWFTSTPMFCVKKFFKHIDKDTKTCPLVTVGVPNDPYGTAWESDHFSSLTGGPNWPPGHSLRKWSFSVALFRHPRGGPNWPFICLDYFMSNIMRMFGSCFVIKSRILLTLKNHFHNSVLKRNMALGLQELLFKRAFGGLFMSILNTRWCASILEADVIWGNDSHFHSSSDSSQSSGPLQDCYAANNPGQPFPLGIF